MKSAQAALRRLETAVFNAETAQLAELIHSLAEFSSNEDSTRVISSYNADASEADLNEGRLPAEELVLRAMDQNPTEMTVQMAACYAIAEFVQVSEELRDRLELLEAWRRVFGCMLKFKDEESLQAIACEAMACLALGSMNRIRMADAGTAELTLQALQIHKSNSTVVSNACKAISLLVEDDLKLQKEWIRSEKRISLIEAFREYIHVEEVVEQVCWALRALISTEKAQAWYLDADRDRDESTHALVIQALHNFKGMASIQAAGLGLLEALSCNIDADKYWTQVMYLVEDCRATELVIDAMAEFSDISQIQEFGCSLIDYLADANKRLRIDDFDGDILEAICDAMSKNRGLENECIRVQEAACRALAKMLNLNPHLTEHIGEDEMPFLRKVSVKAVDSPPNEENMQLLLHRTLMYALMTYAEDVHIFIASCSALFNMAANVRLVKWLVNAGAQLAILLGMKWHRKERAAQEWGCRAIRGLSESPESKKTLRNCGALALMAKVLKRYGDDPVVLEEAIGGLACLATQSLEGFDSHVYDLILDAMEKFQDRLRLQKMALEALSVLATCAREQMAKEEEDRDQSKDEKNESSGASPPQSPVLGFGAQFIHSLNKAGAQRCTVTSMEKNLNCPVVQKNGCLALCQLRDPTKNESPQLLNKIASAIKKAMVRYKDNEDVLLEGCLAVLSLSQHDERYARIFVEHRVHHIFFDVLDDFDDDGNGKKSQKLLEVATDCLFLFRDLKDLMLQYAVAEGKFAATRCLIQSMGADVNGGEDSRSPICVATDRRDVKTVNLLLKQSVANLQKALDIAVNEKFHEIIGLLLRRIGWDKEHGTATWSGLKLGSLNPLWLYPVLRLQVTGFAFTPDDPSVMQRRSDQWIKRISEQSSPSVFDESGLQDDSSRCLSPDVGTKSEEDYDGYDAESEASRPGDVDAVGESSSSSSVISQRRPSYSMRRPSVIKGPLLPTIEDESNELPAEDDNLERKRKLGTTVIEKRRGPSLATGSGEGARSSNPLATPFRRCVSVEFSNLKIDLRELKTMGEAVMELKRAAKEMDVERCSSEEMSVKRRKSMRRDSQGSLMTPSHADTGVKTVKRPLAKRRESLSGTESGATLPFKKFALTVQAPRDWIHSTYRTFSPSLFRRTMAYEENLSSGDDPSPDQSPKTSHRSNFPSGSSLSPLTFPLMPSPLGFGQGPQRMSPFCLTSSEDDTGPSATEADAGDFPPPTGRKRMALAQPLKKSKHFKMVRVLNVSANGISTLQDVACGERELLERLMWMEHLIASQNKLESFPTDLDGWLINLRKLDLQHNEFTIFPLHVLRFKVMRALDLSHNKISIFPSPFDLVSSTNTSLLSELELSHNQIQTFPQWLGQSAPNLSSLNLSHNCIKELPNVPLGIIMLKSLNLSYNSISVLPDLFLSKCPKLECLDLSRNRLGTLPIAEKAALLGDLSEVLLRDNSFGSKDLSSSILELHCHLPEFVLKLPKLKILDVSNTGLGFLPGPAAWSTMTLSTLLAAENQIEALDLGDDSHEQWNFLRRLNLKQNQLKSIPRAIGRLSKLTSLDVSYNGKITKLPLEMGNLKEMWELNLDGLKVGLPFPCDIRRCKTSDIINMLKDSLDNSEKYCHIWLMVLGDESCGKTKLLSAITGQDLRRNLDEGVQIVDWKTSLSPRRGNHSSLWRGQSADTTSEAKSEYKIHCWNFSGAEKYRGAYQCFKASRGVYMVVYKLNPHGERSEVKSVRSWLLNIEARAPLSTVIVIGTHADVVAAGYAESVQAALEDLRGKPGFPEKIFFLEIKHNSSSLVKALKQTVAEAISSATSGGESLLGQMVPKTYQSLANLVLKEAKGIAAREVSFPAIGYPKMVDLAAAAKLSKEHLPQAVRFLRENGVLIHFNNIDLLSDYYILDPAWLCEVTAIVRLKGRVKQPHDAVMGRSVLMKMYEDRLPTMRVEASLQILEKFEIALAFGDNLHYLVPCLLPKQRPPLPIELSNFSASGVVHRHYCLAYIPAGFWSHLIAKISAFSQEMIALAMSDSNKYPLEDMTFWEKGLSIFWNKDAFVLIEEFQEDVVDVLAPTTRYGSSILGTVVDHIDSLIEEWYPGLMRQDIHGIPYIRKRVPCQFCLEPDVHYFDLGDLIEISSVEDRVSCPMHKGEVLLQQLAPDVMVKDLKPQYHIESLDYDTSQTFLLGHGGYGKVYKANYAGKDVAVKEFHSPHGIAACHQQLRQEIMVLQHRHPSIIDLVGISLRPNRLLIMELAQQRSLSELFEHRTKMPRLLQHRIAWQVAEGLAFLHKLRIAYRDLKPSNLLVLSTALSAGVPVNVKLTDFGIACLVPPAGLSEDKGTPSHRAPQVIKRQSYGIEADIYSFGLLLFELVTNGRKLFHDVASQPNRIDDLIAQRSSTIPDSVASSITNNGASQWPDMQDLIRHCLQHRPQDRPTANEIVKRLSKAEFFCLKEVISVDHEMNIEAVAVRKYKKAGGVGSRGGMELWMASGTGSSGPSSQMTIVDMSADKGGRKPWGFALKDRRICCLLAVRESLVLAGTLSNRLWIYDTNAKQRKDGHCLNLPDAVLCLFYFSCRASSASEREDCVLAGLGNGQVAKFDINTLYLEAPNPSYFRLGWDPVTSISSGAKRLWFCHGSEVVVFLHQSNFKKEEKRWKAKDEAATGVLDHLSHVCVGGDQVWTATKQSPQLRCWDAKTFKKRSEINCIEAVRRHYPDPTDCQIEMACRVVSLLLIPRESLWVGTGSGHILLYCPIKLTSLLVMRRSVQPVRCMAHAVGKIEERPVNLVLTGCLGFWQRPTSDKNSAKAENCGSLLIWECDLHRQEQALHEYQKARNAYYERLA
eukprot:m.4866 g.4866  ORF g.4866 m.4866 type:complete len:2830 (+) comp11455_c0_seq1:269-8758(+)